MAIRLNPQHHLNVSNQTLNNENNIYMNQTTPESIKLATKLRKIKENLDNCYLNSNNNNKSVNSTICSPNLNDSLNNKQLTEQQAINSNQNSPVDVYRPNYSSKYLLINQQKNFKFELNNNSTSLDNLLLEQFSGELTSNIGFSLEKETNKIKNNTKNQVSFSFDNNDNNNNNNENNETNSIPVRKAVYTENVSRQSSIRSLLSENNSNFAKITSIKANNKINSDKNLKKNEFDLIKNWDKPKASAFNVYNPNFKNSTQRPQTRLGFQNDSSDMSCSLSNNNSEYSDNVTVASTSSSNSGTNIKYQDYNKECDNSSTRHKNDKNCLYVNMNYNDKNLNNSRMKFDAETESVLSDFVSNLKFDDVKSKNYSQNTKLKEVQHDYDINATSDTYSDDYSINLNQNNIASNMIKKMNGHTPSFIIREKKIAQTKKLNNSYNQIPKINSRSNLINNINRSANMSLIENLNENEREQNYKRLSHSINDLFVDLLEHLEKQKNKDYLVDLDYDLNRFNNNDLSYTNLLFNNSINKSLNQSNKNPTFSPEFSNNNNNNINNKRTVLNQNISKDSNKDKDSGFNQESSSLYDSNSPHIIKNKIYMNNMELNHIDQNLLNNSNLKPTETYNQAFNNDQNELSLLERYLYNEQVIAEKHSKIESLIQKYLNEKNLCIDDYSLIEYVLNQEGISFKTFKQLIREKFSTIEWHDHFLKELYQILNENEFSDSRNESNMIGEEIENNLNQHQYSRSVITHDTVNISNSRSSSSRSYRRIKDLKNLMSSKRRIMNDSLEASDSVSDNYEEEEILKKNLSSSFTKRRERKGSLPEVVNNNNTIELEINGFSYYSMGSNATLTMNCSNNYICNEENCQNNRSKNDTDRHSRKGAFVLEVLRNSMLRSKSLSDLSKSMQRIDNSNYNTINNTSNNNTLCSYKYSNKSIATNLNFAHLNEINIDYLNSSIGINSLPLNENYIGLIWQCADMCYVEYKNKYKELGWLLNGDNLSASSKLKEIEQRIRIELNLKEKNLLLLEDLNKNSDLNNETSSDKSLRTRLLNQLKVINDKIKEFELMRLFLRVCEINSHGLEQDDIDEFFNSYNCKQIDLNHNQFKAKSLNDITKLLYGKDAISNGFVYQFFVTYRYMCSSMQLFEFFRENFNKASSSSELNKSKTDCILERTIDLLAMWLDGFYTIDFQQNQELSDELEKFIDQELKLYNESKYRILYNLLHNPNIEFNLFAKKTNSFKKLNQKNKKQNNEPKKSSNGLFNGAFLKKRILNSSNLNKRARSCSKNKSIERLNQDDFNTTMCSSIRNDFFINDYEIDLIASQLTLIEWDHFLDIHVCHCLNSKAQGVNFDSKQPIDPNIINSQQCLFVDKYFSKSVYKMIEFNYLLTHWVSAEILLLDTVKNQANLITKFLKIAKKCTDWANFSTAFSIYEGLQDLTIRNLPAWQHISNKSIHIIEKLASFKILFQNDPFAILNLSKSYNLPVIPSMHLFLLSVQQNELGSFQLTNGLWKWAKLSFLAKLVDQIRIVQQHYVCYFEPCEDFVDDLMQRIYYIKDFDLNNLAESSCLDYQSQKLNTNMLTIKNLIPNKKKNY